MKKGFRLFIQIHRATGCIIALFFLMWFVSGLILIYHPYPRLSDKELYEKKEELPPLLPSISSITQRGDGKLQSLSIRQFLGQTLVSIATADTSFTYSADGKSRKKLDFPTLERLASQWIDDPVAHVDTLHERAQWILYSRYDRVMPIYKFYYNNPSKQELFISGKTGEVQQLTDREQRFWAWVGAIPHKLYLPFLRKHLELWKGCITAGAIFCVLAALSGLIVGFWSYLKRYRQTGLWYSPYQKSGMHWHHVLGMWFGLFVLAWGISGIFAMQRIPQWLIPTDGKYILNSTQLWGKGMLPLKEYQLDYRKIKKIYPDLKEIRWTRFQEIPAYQIIAGNQELWIDASSSKVKPLHIPEETIRTAIRHLHGDNVSYRLTLIEQYDNYYLSRDRELPLPVYKVVVDDAIQSRYYICPQTGYTRYLNINKMVKKWVFNGIHYLHIQWLVERPILWTICIWILGLGGASVCLTGCWIGIRYVWQKSRHG